MTAVGPGGQVRLAPLYDIASALPYPDFYEPRLKLAMKIGGEYRADWIRGEHWQQLAKELSLDDSVLLERIADLAQRLPEAMERTCKEQPVRELTSALPRTLTERVAAHAERYARMIRPSA